MIGFLLRLAVNALGLWLATRIVPGMEIAPGGTLLAAALLLGVVNALVRPLAIVLTLPFTIVTLGLFVLVVNAAMLGLVAWLLEDFRLSGFGAALFGSIIVSLTGWLSSFYIGPRGRLEAMVIERDMHR
jgi:putative membrane protein